MRKIVSSIAAAAIAVSTISFFSVSASAFDDADVNTVSLMSETLTEAIEVDNTIIPAGTTAVSVYINNNVGFNASSTKFQIGTSADVVKTTGGKIVIAKGDALGDSIIAGVETNDVAAFSTASAESNKTDGKLFTFYTSSFSESKNSVSVLSSEFSDYGEVTVESVYNNNRTHIHYIHGDVNNDNDITPADAVAYEQARAKSASGVLPLSWVNAAPTYFFPTIVYPEAASIYFDNRSITYNDYTYVVLLYDSLVSTGQPFDPSDIDPLCNLGMVIDIGD